MTEDSKSDGTTERVGQAVEQVGQAVGQAVDDIGSYIRAQRETAQVSLRQLARTAGVSNPYLSQIERGLRKPSAEILQQIAKGLRISAEALYVKAGILEERPLSVVTDAVLSDVTLTERQKQVLLDIYQSFRRENDLPADPGEPAVPTPEQGK
ncbi:helix-turn-helix domain-containing protein [Pseudonocardia sp. T1-2H]|uniref:helix-turn-helix domain-containing protein n=1 Tax=Pseudonocardia sp. T1-2H TaxID=3128899 RepID=UPI00310147CB